MEVIEGRDSELINFLKNKIKNEDLSEKQKAYYNRVLRVFNMPDLSEREGHPVRMIIDNIISHSSFKKFEHVKIPEIVSEYETFDLFNFPKDHVTRRPSDSYFIDKNSDPKNSYLLRPHTSVVWYYYFMNYHGKSELEKNGEVDVLSWGKVYRVDDLDTTHHECFHQIDGLRISEKDKYIITQDDLKKVLGDVIIAIFGEDVKYRFNDDEFPYTYDSLEVEVDFNGERLEVLGGGIVNPTVLEELGIDSTKYNGWAFGFGIERLAMALKKVPDIRMFWSEDKRITKQWGDFSPFETVSNLPPVYKDISFIVPKDKFVKDEKESEKEGEIKLIEEADSFDIAGIARDVSGDLIEEVKVVDIFESDKKFGENHKSVSIRITFRALDRTLTNEEINNAYFQIRYKLETELGYILR